jgi:AcrR family transcriptional regulator
MQMELTKDTPRARLMTLTPERRAQLLDPAETEFAEHGYQSASLNRILASAGMSKGQAYYYISDKADLYGAVIERAAGRLVKDVDFAFTQPADADEFWEQVGELFARVTSILMANERLAALARNVHEGAETSGALAEPIGRLHEGLEYLIAAGQAVGAVRDDVPRSLLQSAAFAAVRQIDRWFGDHWDELEPQEALDLDTKALEMVRGLVAPTSGGAK